jgi:hypothetical protein
MPNHHRDAVEGGVLAFYLGELGVAPRVYSMWTMGLAQHRMQVCMVAEPLIALPPVLALLDNRTGGARALQGPRGVGLQAQLVAHVSTIAALGYCFIDLHPGNVLLRPARLDRRPHERAVAAIDPLLPDDGSDPLAEDGAWEGVLTDFDRKYMVWDPHQSVDCRKLMMLLTLSLGLACARAPRSAFSDEIETLLRSPMLGLNCASMDSRAHGSKHAEVEASSRTNGDVHTDHAFENEQSSEPDLTSKSARAQFFDHVRTGASVGTFRQPCVEHQRLQGGIVHVLRKRWSDGLPPL